MSYKQADGRFMRRVTPPVLTLASALLAALLAQAVTGQGLVRAVGWAAAHPVPFLLTALLLLAPILVGYGISGRLWVGFLPTAALVLALTLVDLYKTRINGTPLLLEDLHLSGQLWHIAGYTGGRLRLTLPTLLALALALGWTLLLGLAGGKRLRLRSRGRLLAGLGGLALCGALALPWGLRGLAASLDGLVTQEERVTEQGVTWGFYSAWAVSGTRRAEIRRQNQDLGSRLYQVRQDIQVTAATPQTPPPALLPSPTPAPVVPTVIFLMSESFFDLQRLPGVQFETDPQPNFHRLAAAHSAGPFYSSTFCGGTGYVELEVQTGLCSYLLNEGDSLPALPPERYRTLPTVAGRLGEEGYQLVYLHSHTKSLYNREEIYNAMGFSQVLFRESFPADAALSGGYLSDMALTEQIIRLYEARDPAKPLFLSAVSMENHQPYGDGKYGGADDYGLSAPALDETGLSSLRAYAQGAGHADAALGALTDYFSALLEPVMLVFWGDHLPSLGAGGDETVYSQLGYCDGPVTTDWSAETLARMLSADYLIWTNYEEAPAEGGPESCTFLGVDVLARLGLPLEGYFGWLQRVVEPALKLYRPRLYLDSEGVPRREAPPEDQAMLQAYRLVVGDMVYGDNLIFCGEGMP